MSNDLICYCFEYTAEDIQQDYKINRRSTIMEKIQAEKKFGNCRCSVKNPKGRWCLVDVRRVVDNVAGKTISQPPK